MIELESKKVFRRLIDLQSLKITERQRRHLKWIVPISASILMLLFWLSMVIGLLLCDDNDISKVSLTFCAIVGYPAVPFIHWHLFINHDRFCELLNDMAAIATDSSSESIAREMLYEKLRRRVKISLKVFERSLRTAPLPELTPFIYVAYHLCLGSYTMNSWIMYFTFWTPFELNTTPQYMFLAICQVLPACYAYLCILSTFSVMIECVLYVGSFMGDMKLLIGELDRVAITGGTESVQLDSCKRAIELHYRIYECMDKLNPLFNGIFSIMVPPFTICIIFSLLAIDSFLDGMPMSNLQFPTVTIVLALSTLFALFFTGQKLNFDLAALSEDIYQLQWERYPPKVRRFILIMMMRTQKPFYLTACGVIKLNLETFVDVVRFIYSVFMVLQGLD